MKQFNFGESNLTPEGFVHDRHTAAIVTMSKPHKISGAQKFKDDLQKRHGGMKKRKVFVSKGYLKYAQDRVVRSLLKNIFYDKFNTEHIISYKKGVDPHEVLKRECIGKDLMVKFDIKKYYDNITSNMIYNSLRKLGFNHSGAKMITKLCTVKINGRYTLQQGSSVSPLISNVVGHFYLDKPIMKYLDKVREKYPRLEVTYKRYCDNIGIWLDGPIPGNLLEPMKADIKEMIKPFRTHDWYTISGDHPKMAQTFLGVTLNEHMKIPKFRYERVRALLFNAATKDTILEAAKYFQERGEEVPLGLGEIKEKFLQRMRGFTTYVKKVNSKQGLELEKLISAIDIVGGKPRMIDKLDDNVFWAIKQYGKKNESLETYKARLM